MFENRRRRALKSITLTRTSDMDMGTNSILLFMRLHSMKRMNIAAICVAFEFELTCANFHTSHSIHRIEWFAQGDSEKSCNFCACKCAHLYASIIENDFINGQQRWALITVHFSQMPKCWNEAKSRRLHSIGRVNTIGQCWPKAHPQPTPFLLIKVIAIDAIDSHRCKNISTIQKLAKLSINKKSKIECR